MKNWIKTILLSLLVVGLLLPSLALAAVQVKGYFRSNSTYVQPHYRSNPNKSIWDNWSTKGNYNPQTGKKGTVDPFKSYKFRY